ncbi:GNAT family N-acetyltransferase [Actinokineospora enzanensis]|uniref:GNAT family N-acetyltransferase n=1 Tax=Actinokineospora enzanensis TaxID=155975 RepID=UPI000367F855|nr:GNAT family N-acetyltransferase [Actinokineospora enzanensis]
MWTDTTVRRIAEFEEHFARAQATSVVESGWGYTLLQSDFPASWHHNRLVVTGLVDPVEVVATADQVFDRAGLAHRLVQFNVNGAAAAQTFAAAGYQVHERILTMLHVGALPERTGQVESLDFATLRPSLVRDWRADYPEDSDEQIAQLADRVLLYERGAEVEFLVVRDASGEILSRAELYIGGGVAQFENLITRPESRGMGHARALVADALHRGREAGASVNFLIAQADDWPRGWYSRLGYQGGPLVHVYQRTP